MNSPTHKENILNPNYQDIGIGVVEGGLMGTDTTIIVQFFGTSLNGANGIPQVEAKNVTTATATPSIPTLLPTPTARPSELVNATNSSVAFVSPFSSTKGISLLVTGIILMVLSIDFIVIKRNKIIRVGGKTLAHIAFIGMILAVILILKAGQII